MTDKPQTLQQAIVHFADKDIAREYLVALRWSEGVVCPFCEGKEHSYLTTRKSWKCKACKKQFSVKVGTIFENSPIGLDKWLPLPNSSKKQTTNKPDSLDKFESLLKKILKVPPKEIEKPKKKRRKQHVRKVIPS